MSQFVVYIKLEVYLQQWLTHSLGSPVTFPAQSNENAIIRRFLQRTPPDRLPDTAFDGATPINIPDSKAKPVTSFNYLGPTAKAALIEAIEDLFRINLWNEMSSLIDSSTVGVNTLIGAWCEMHGIELDYVETVRQKYYRMRKSYEKKGIILSSLTRKRTDKNAEIMLKLSCANNPEQ